MLALMLLTIVGATDERVLPREEREECDLVPGECYGMDVWRRCRLSENICLRLPIEEVAPPPRAEARLDISAPCGVDALVWAKTRIPAITKKLTASGFAIVGSQILACDSANPRIDAVIIEPL